MSTPRKAVLALTLAAALTWAGLNWPTLSADSGVTRVVLCAVFSLLLLCRPKAGVQGSLLRSASFAGQAGVRSQGSVIGIGVAGTLVSIVGLVLTIHYFKWVGILLLLFACVSWALPRSSRPDVIRAFFILFWAHPLPSQIFNPLRFAMQRISVEGAEIVLHCINVRVWAENMVLHTATHTIGVPEACSGMSTASAVFLCLLGVGMLFRFRIGAHVLLILAGLAQVLLLNIVRISYVVAKSAGKPDAWSAEALHDTTGTLLLAAIVLVNLEAAAWRAKSVRRRARQKAVDDGEVEPEDHTSIVHPFWSALIRHRGLVVLALVFTALFAFAAFKRRPYHRAMMIAETVGGLTDRNRADAEAAIKAAINMLPDDSDLHTQHVKVLLLRKKYRDALLKLKKVAPEDHSVLHTILEALALMSLERPDEAVELVEDLPSHDRKLPGVAMVRAEFSARRDEPDLVASNIVRAASWGLMIDRARALFPYLAARRQWSAIAKCHSRAPYRDVRHALAAIHAHIKTRQYTRAGNLLVQSMESWPAETKLLEYLAALAMEQPGGEWEDIFAEKVRDGIKGHSEDELALFIEASFRLSRPELAWLAYRRLEAVSPDDPAVLLAPAQYGDRWFTFRKEQLGTASDGTADVRDDSSPLRRAIIEEMDPLSGELTPEAVRKKRKEYLQACLDELDRREKEDDLSLRLKLMHVNALELSGEYEQAYDRLEKIAGTHPDRRREVLLRKAAFYERQGNPAGMYEMLREHGALSDEPDMTASLMRINSLMLLGLGAYAMTAAEEAQAVFPESREIVEATAAILAVFRFPGEALFVLSRSGSELPDSPFVARLLWDAQLFKEAAEMWQHMRIRPPTPDETPAQHVLLPPAELAVGTNLNAAARADQPLPADSISPFVNGLASLISGNSFDMQSWTAIGRDDHEKAMALYELAVVQLGRGRREDAEKAVARALELLPHASPLWRLRVRIAEDRTAAVAGAREACPFDSEIWLAEVVTRSQGSGVKRQEEIVEMVRGAAREKRFSAGTFVRAGDYLLRSGHVEAADAAARHAAGRVEGFLPANLLAIRTSLALGQMARAIAQSELAGECAVRPAPFHRLTAELRTAIGRTDDDTVASLQRLVKASPDDRMLIRRLGDVYLRRGDTRRAMSIFTSLVSDQPRNAELASLVGAAEAARRSGRLQESLGLLEDAHRIYPSSRIALNNLVYNLAMQDKTLARARALLPDLVRLFGEDSVAALDTIAIVRARSGQTDAAKTALEKAIELVDETDPLWFLMNPTAVELDPYLNLPAAARDATVIQLAEKLARKVERVSRKTSR